MKLKVCWILFPFMLIAAGVFRAYQLFVAIDTQTGFYRDGNVSRTLLVVSLLLFTAIVWFINRRANTANEGFTPQKGYGMAGICLLIVASDIYYAYLLLQEFILDRTQYTVLALFATTGLSIITWLLFMISYVLGTNVLDKVKGVVLLLPVWVIVRIVVSFMRYTAMADISSNLFDVVSMCAMLYLMYNLARIWGGVEVAKAKKSFFFFSLISAVLVLVCVVTVIAAMLHEGDQGFGKINLPAYSFTFTDILMTFFCLSLAAKFSTVEEQVELIPDTEELSIDLQDGYDSYGGGYIESSEEEEGGDVE